MKRVSISRCSNNSNLIEEIRLNSTFDMIFPKLIRKEYFNVHVNGLTTMQTMWLLVRSFLHRMVMSGHIQIESLSSLGWMSRSNDQISQSTRSSAMYSPCPICLLLPPPSPSCLSINSLPHETQPPAASRSFA